MTSTEYEEVKELTYREYCDYLQEKYGYAKAPYMTSSGAKKRITRTKEGLYIHHKYEDCVARLCDSEIAKEHPYAWQLPENLIYCNLLEHLLLHILICEYPSSEKDVEEIVGIRGIVTYLIPELNNLYSGYLPDKEWQKNCYNVVSNNKGVYLQLLKRFKDYCLKNIPEYTVYWLLMSRQELSQMLHNDIIEL